MIAAVRLIVAGVAGALCAAALGQSAPALPEVGAPAPALTVTHLLQAPEGTPAPEALSWKHFEGQIVVLEFWATWCGPCIAAVPHLNQLAEEFKGHDIRFLSITDEEPAKVEPFIAKRPMRSWVAMDTTGETARGFGIRSIPRTVLIDRTGRIAAVTYPTALTAEVLRDLLAGKAVKVEGAGTGLTAGVPPAADPDAPAPIFHASIRPALVGSYMSAREGGRLTALGMDVRAMVSMAYNFPARDRIEVPEAWREGSYEVVIAVPEGREALFAEVFQAALRVSLGIVARLEERDLDVYILTQPPGAPGLARTDGVGSSGTRAGPGVIDMKNVPGTTVVSMLEQGLRGSIVDEVGLGGRYSLNLKWDPADADGLAAALQAETGLVLTRGVRRLPVLVVEGDE